MPLVAAKDVFNFPFKILLNQIIGEIEIEEEEEEYDTEKRRERKEKILFQKINSINDNIFNEKYETNFNGKYYHLLN